MAQEKTKIFSAEACIKMLSNYENTAATALGYVDAKRALTARDQLTPHGLAPSVGEPAAPITLVLFADFTNSNCARASAMATSLRNLYSSQARLVFRQLPSAKRPEAHLAAQASLAAHAQGKFWRFYEVLFGNTQAQDRAALERYAQEAGLDLPTFKKALDRRTYAPDVDADIELARKLGISEVPMLFANGRAVSMPYGVTELAELIREATP
jgi:protein-disulfide isomerase